MRVDPRFTTFVSRPRPQIYVEIDWMDDVGHSHKPSQAVVDKIVSTFANAGYDIHIDVSNVLAHQTPITINGTPSSSTDVINVMAANFNHAADPRYFYSLWCHNYRIGANPITTSSGIADFPGRVHLVSLGSFPGQVGTFNHQVGTLIHEFGHNIGQQHGGSSGSNYKPNYLSVMNYHYQLSGIGPVLNAFGWAGSPAGFDQFGYSYGVMPSLNEAGLNENVGVGLGRAVDWNCNGFSTDTGVVKDIQDSAWCTTNAGVSLLQDFDNWSFIKFFIPADAPGAQGGRQMAVPVAPAEPCITWEEQQRVEAIVQTAAAARGGAGPGAGEAEGEPPPPSAVRIYNDGPSLLTISSIALDTPSPWLTWSPQSPFNVPAGLFQDLTLQVDLKKNAPAGRTMRRLIVNSNDTLSGSPFPGGIYVILEFDGLLNEADGSWTRY